MSTSKGKSIKSLDLQISLQKMRVILIPIIFFGQLNDQANQDNEKKITNVAAQSYNSQGE